MHSIFVAYRLVRQQLSNRATVSVLCGQISEVTFLEVPIGSFGNDFVSAIKQDRTSVILSF